MGSKMTNDAKRLEMGRATAQAMACGWTAKQLAAYFRVSDSTIRVWRRSKSMGTNAQRAQMAALRSPGNERPRILGLVDFLRRNAATEDEFARRASIETAHLPLIARRHSRKAANMRERAAFLETIGK